MACKPVAHAEIFRVQAFRHDDVWTQAKGAHVSRKVGVGLFGQDQIAIAGIPQRTLADFAYFLCIAISYGLVAEDLFDIANKRTAFLDCVNSPLFEWLLLNS